jgi:hypothetical protein
MELTARSTVSVSMAAPLAVAIMYMLTAGQLFEIVRRF